MPEEEIVQSSFTIIPYLPYIVSVLCSLISGFASYAATRKQTRAEIQRLEKQHVLDLEKERELFQMEKEKMELSHKYEMELKQKELESALGNTLISEAMKMPEVRQQLSQGVRQGAKKKH